MPMGASPLEEGTARCQESASDSTVISRLPGINRPIRNILTKKELTVVAYLPREERSAPEKLGEDASDAPKVHRVSVQPIGAEHQLRRAVPTRDHVLGHRVIHLQSDCIDLETILVR